MHHLSSFIPAVGASPEWLLLSKRFDPRRTVPDITVYIPAYNVAQFLPRAIESLLTQTLSPTEILVIDDGSTDDSANIAQRYPRVNVVRHERNSGFAAARNTAFRTARGQFMASLDADCVAKPTWLENLAPHLKDGEIAGAGGFLREGVQTSIADRWRRAHMPQEWGATPVRNPKFSFGLQQYFQAFGGSSDRGGYDGTMRTNGEDGELSRQLYARNWNLNRPAAQATHLRSDSVKSILDTYWRWWKIRGERLRIWNFASIGRGSRSLCPFPSQFELLSIDILLLAYLPYRDFRPWLESNGNPVSQRSSAGA